MMRVAKTVLTLALSLLVAWAGGGVLGALLALGPARIAKSEASALSVVATLAAACVVAGLGVLWWRTARRWWWRALAFVAAVPCVAVGALPTAVAVWAAHPVHPALTAEAPAGARAVTVPCGDDVTLAAWYLPTQNDAAVVLSHGAGSTRGAVAAHARALADAGYGVLLLDARGHGGSSGAPMELGWWGEADLECAVDALLGLPDVDPDRIGLVGMSMGAEASLGAAGADARVAAVVAEGATARTAADKDGWLPGGPLGALQRAMDAERDLLLRALTPAPAPTTLRDATRASDAEVLLITAGTVANEAAAAEWIAEGDDDVETWNIEGAAHTGGIVTVPDEWRDRVVAFLDDALD